MINFKKFFRGYLLTLPMMAFSSSAWAEEQVVVQRSLSTVQNIIQIAIEYIVKYSFQALGGIAILVIGWIVAKYVAKFVSKLLAQQAIDITVAKFIVSGVKMVIMAFAIIVALGKFGIEIAPLIAGISVVGFGTSFALQGPLSNYAAGITLIFTKPFKVGDIITVVNEKGQVLDMKLSRTEIKTVDGTVVVIPNKHIIGEIIHNDSQFKRLDLNIGVGYKVDIEKAIALVNDIVKNEPLLIHTRNFKVGITTFGDSSINLIARVWCQQDDYWDALFSLNKKVLAAFQKQGIEIPFPQREVHVYEHKA